MLTDDEDSLLSPKSFKAILLTVIILMSFPLTALESEIYSGPPREYYPWDYGMIKQPVLLVTEITPPEREVKNVRWFGNGSCVPYARRRTGIKLYGWAKYFMEDAEKAGYATSSTPVKGGMVTTTEGGGHVAVVEEIKGDKLVISEQNFKGYYIVSYREISATSSVIKGYIY